MAVRHLILRFITGLSFLLAGHHEGCLATENHPLAAITARIESRALELAKHSRALSAKGDLENALATANKALPLMAHEYGAGHEYVAYLLDDIAGLNSRLGHPSQALDFAYRALEVTKKALGTDSSQFALMANNLATILFQLGRFKEAEQFYQTAYQGFVSSSGLSDRRTFDSLKSLAITYLELLQFNKAKEILIEALGHQQRYFPKDIALKADLLLDLASVYLRLEAHQKALATSQQARQLLLSQIPVNPEQIVKADLMLARIDVQESELGQAQKRLNKSLATLRRGGLQNNLTMGTVLYQIGFIQILRGEAVEAEKTFKKVLSIYQTHLGQDHAAIARSLHGLAIAYSNLGEFDQASKMFIKAIGLFTRNLGAVNISVASTRQEFSLMLSHYGYSEIALAEAQKAVAIYDQLAGSWELERAYAYSALGFALYSGKQLDRAATAFEKAIALLTKIRGNESSDLPPGLTELAKIRIDQNRLDEAEEPLQQAIAIRAKDQAATPYGLIRTLSVLTNLRLKQSKPEAAIKISKRIVQIMQERLLVAQSSLSDSALGEQRSGRSFYEQYLEIAQSQREQKPKTTDTELEESMFRVAQLPHLSGTATSVSRMAIRLAAEHQDRSSLVGKHQKAIERWRYLDRLRTDLLVSHTSSRRQNKIRLEQEKLLTQIEFLNDALREQFPAYAELTNPQPVSRSELQRLLKPDEALFLHVSTTIGTFVFLIRSDRLRIINTQFSADQLDQAVESIRKGLELQNTTDISDLLQFDITTPAHQLYQNLIQPLEADLDGVRHIITVVDRSLQNLPLSLLLVSPVQSPPNKFADYRHLNFLGRHYAFSVVPSVSAFTVLRAMTKTARSSQAFIGFGDPDFNGGKIIPAQRATQLQDLLVTRIDPNILRAKLVSLPETRSELFQMAKSLHAGKQSLFLGDKATEAVIKSLPLSNYRILAFATHGLLAGNFRGLAEPALAMTPPIQATEIDDGLLTASEIATLNLDADWVILSACNTAAPTGRPGAEGLSGLAKAFFYAGSRALLVSHWVVESDATVLLTTGALKNLVENPKIGRAEALQRAMLPLMNGEAVVNNQTQPLFAHPVFWAPFINVGEGGRQ